ncbi:hypothetical protein HYH02_003556 [Chlamydomonas schloesseri]|uniref:ATP-dependent DNA helicase n=1 Tax=Chlamydomonas schloesseri TaxID=2026947 RepID=A0A836B9H5_9CHLO|nr:hypothetical protein HYH02_003556 [Chlamydomonas schloesseri]|eukprot:KAG2451777.1 hypothetical protein HYH02_003556 [Chlamydomonas schloesseri]
MSKRSLSFSPTEHDSIAKRPNVRENNRQKALCLLKKYYGFDAFRGKQEDAVLSAMAGQDALVIMPTGGGKTLCYVIPALAQPGLAVVVSPLLALMQDQVNNLKAVGVPAAQLSSALPAAQREAILTDLGGGGGGGGEGGSGMSAPSLKLLLVTPELLAASKKFRYVLRRLHSARLVSLFAIDESHCISTWGHDFRPAYRQLGSLRSDYPGVPIMALTATAASQVQDDICKQLRLQSPLRLCASFNRPNISYSVRYLDVEGAGEAEALVRLLTERRRAAGGVLPCSIVYATKRDTCEDVAARLCRDGLAAAAYHGQMGDAKKREVLAKWQADEVPVVVATIAFGMGIDKAGVRLVVHLNLPSSLEGFYQEAGRAGRDGAPAESVLFYSREARRRMDYVLEKEQEKAAREGGAKGPKGPGGGAAADDSSAGGGFVTAAAAARAAAVAAVAAVKAGEGGAGGANSSPTAAAGAGAKGAGGHGVDSGRSGGGSGDDDDSPSAASAAAGPSAAEDAAVKKTAWQAFGRVVDWALAPRCRRRALLAHFGEALQPAGAPCAGTGNGEAAGCDVCRDREAVLAALEALKQQELAAAAQRQAGGWWGKGGGGGGKKGGDDEEADMFAVRGGGGGGGDDDGGGGQRADKDEGPGVYNAGRHDEVPVSAATASAARAAAAAARSAAGGQVNSAYFDALEAREREHERRQQRGGGDIVDRMLSAVGGGGGGGGASAAAVAAPPPDEGARANARNKLAGALAGNVACAGLEPDLLQRLAAAVEAEVYGNGHVPRQQYTSRMAGLLSRARAAPSALALLPQAPPAAAAAEGSPAGSGASGGGAVVAALSAAAAAPLLPALLQGEVAAVEAVMQPAASPADSPAQPQARAPAPLDRPTKDRLLGRLRCLAAVAVGVEAVAAGGVGRRLAALGKLGKQQAGSGGVGPGPGPEVVELADAARGVVAAWKRQLPERAQ